MAIPISYNIRNLMVRRTTTLMTALGIALTVSVLMAIMALVEGLRTSLEAAGHPLHILVLRKGSTSELTSNFSRASYQDLKFKPGIARNGAGEPMASLEMVTVILLEDERGKEGMNVTLRGLLPIGIEMREGLRIIEGRAFEAGKRELLVGKGVAGRYPSARLGQKLQFGRGEWTVVGIFDAGRSAANGEVWADLNQLSSDQNRSEVLSSCLIRAADEVALQALMNDIGSDRRFNVSVITEKAYYEQQTRSAAPVQTMGMFVAVIMAVGSCFAAMNTMYAAVARRGAEIGTLRVLGFSRASILMSFLLESLFLSLLGGLLGCLLVLPLNNIQTGIGSIVTFSELTFQFQVSPPIMGAGIVFALALGAVGGLFPARMASRKEILAALREA
jgi:putative ABC transport system permease protein